MVNWPRLIGTGLLFCGLAATQTPNSLRCEWQVAPIAVQTSAPRFSWIIGTDVEGGQNIRQSAYRLIVGSSKAAVAKHVGNEWDSARISSSNTLGVSYAGKDLSSSAVYYWAVESWDQSNKPRWSTPYSFRTGLLRQQDWSGTWITAASSPETIPSLPLFRREFQINKTIASAVAYVSGLGQYELRLNGAKVGDAVLEPGWTDYRKTVLYNAFDITSALHKGDNVFGVMLGNGMYNVQETKGRYTKFKGTFGVPKLIFQAQITFTDGSSMRIASDHTWRTIQGPITFSSVYGGEDYDARLEQSGWDRPGFREKDWLEAQETEGPGGKLRAQQSPEIKVAEQFVMTKVTEPASGVFVYDLGRNFAGWPEISVRGPRGSVLTLISGELLDRDGFVSQRSTGGPQWFSYTLKGQSTETWHPRFSYWGFRYVQVERQPDAGILPEIVSVKGQFLYASAMKTGTFESSSELLNATHRLIAAAIQSNLQSILTDCPHREKLGWLEESHLLGSALMYNFDLATFYEKVANDMADAQTRDGLIPDIAPEFAVFEEGFRDSPEWGSAFILGPWLAYERYGDTEIIASHYDAMKRYVEYLGSKATDNVISYGLGDWFDIGPGEPGPSKLTSLGVTATAIYYQDLITLGNSAKVLNRSEDETKWRQKAAEVRTAFNKRYYIADTHVYDHASQTAYAIALVNGLAPEKDRAAILDRLVADVRAHGNHVTAGDIGFHYLVKALADNGRSDVLFDMLSRTDSPSYGYQLKHGATTLTEAWDANPLDSQNHFMLGHAEEWFYRGLAGIDFDLSRTDNQRLIIRPSPVGGLKSAGATYESVMGTVTSKWTVADGVFTLAVDVPANLSAQVQLPDHSMRQVGSGHYVFRSKI